jgi:hypothetical protein
MATALLLAGPGDSGLSQADLLNILINTDASLQDFEFQFEGRREVSAFPSNDEFKAPDRRLSKLYKRPEDMGFAFQGTFAHRSDHAAHEDVTIKPRSERDPSYRRIQALLQRVRSSRRLLPDAPERQYPDTKAASSIAGMQATGSPLWLVLYLYLLETLEGGEGFTYEFVEWDTLHGNRCAVISLDWKSGKSGKSLHKLIYWVDVARGGHVLQRDEYRDGQFASRILDIQLAKFVQRDGRPVWLPVSARVEDYSDGLGRYARRPRSTQTFSILEGTLKLAQGLPDSRFQLDYGLDAVALELSREANSKVKKPAPRVIDPRSTKEVLRDELVKAESISRGDVAISRARHAWYVRHSGSIVLVAGAAAVFIAAGLLRRRMG